MIFTISPFPILCLVAERVTKIRFSGTWDYSRKMGLRASWTRPFLIFLAKCLPYLKIFQVFAAPSVAQMSYAIWIIFFHAISSPLWKIIKYSKNLAKNEENPCLTCLQPISPQYYATVDIRNPGIRYTGISGTRVSATNYAHF